MTELERSRIEEVHRAVQRYKDGTATIQGMVWPLVIAHKLITELVEGRDELVQELKQLQGMPVVEQSEIDKHTASSSSETGKVEPSGDSGQPPQIRPPRLRSDPKRSTTHERPEPTSSVPERRPTAPSDEQASAVYDDALEALTEDTGDMRVYEASSENQVSTTVEKDPLTLGREGNDELSNPASRGNTLRPGTVVWWRPGIHWKPRFGLVVSHLTGVNAVMTSSGGELLFDEIGTRGVDWDVVADPEDAGNCGGSERIRDRLNWRGD